MGNICKFAHCCNSMKEKERYVHLLVQGVLKEMSLEAIKTISEAEERARQAKADAAAAAKKQIAEAEEKGRQALEQAKKRAADEVRGKRQLVADKAREDAVELVRTTENKKATLLVKANSRADLAVNLVIERIVNG